MSPEEFSKHVLPVFVTPVVNYQWPDSDELNTQLREYVLELEKSEQSTNKSNVGGWHSSLDFLASETPATAPLRSWPRWCCSSFPPGARPRAASSIGKPPPRSRGAYSS